MLFKASISLYLVIIQNIMKDISNAYQQLRTSQLMTVWYNKISRLLNLCILAPELGDCHSQFLDWLLIFINYLPHQVLHFMKFLFWANLLCKFVWNWFVTVWFRLRWSMNWNKFQFLSAQLGQVITSLCLLWVWPKYQYTLLENIIGLYPWPCESGLTLQLISSKSRSQEAWPTPILLLGVLPQPYVQAQVSLLEDEREHGAEIE